MCWKLCAVQGAVMLWAQCAQTKLRQQGASCPPVRLGACPFSAGCPSCESLLVEATSEGASSRPSCTVTVQHHTGSTKQVQAGKLATVTESLSAGALPAGQPTSLGLGTCAGLTRQPTSSSPTFLTLRSLGRPLGPSLLCSLLPSSCVLLCPGFPRLLLPPGSALTAVDVRPVLRGCCCLSASAVSWALRARVWRASGVADRSSCRSSCARPLLPCTLHSSEVWWSAMPTDVAPESSSDLLAAPCAGHATLAEPSQQQGMVVGQDAT